MAICWCHVFDLARSYGIRITYWHHLGRVTIAYTSSGATIHMDNERTLRDRVRSNLQSSIDLANPHKDKTVALAYDVGLMQSLLVELMLADSRNYELVSKRLRKLREKQSK
jgi:hypothetical protein